MKRLASAMPLFALLLPGCANFSPLTRVSGLKPGSNYWLTYDSTRRGAYVTVAADGKLRSCAEPAPDSAYGFSSGLKASRKSPEGSTVEMDAALVATLNELAGRDNLVLIARDAMFRTCELRANGDITSAEAKQMYDKALDTISKIAEVEQARAKQAEATAQRAETELKTLQLQSQPN